MNSLRSLTSLALLLCSALAQAAEGLVVLPSPHGAAETMSRLELAVQQRGLLVFARIDHAAGAAKVGQALRPTELLIFGNPQGGTPLLRCAQSAGIDLPLKALVWEDAAARVWLGHNDPAHIAERHEIAQCPVVGKLSEALADIAASVVTP